MARPLTKGPALTFRLPIAAHRVLAERAERSAMPVTEYVIRYLVRATEQAQPTASGQSEPVTHEPEPEPESAKPQLRCHAEGCRCALCAG